MAGLAVAICAGACAAQGHGLFFTFPKGNVYTGSEPVIVEMWAEWQPSGFYYAWAGWSGKISSSDPLGLWSNLASSISTGVPGTSAGMASAGQVGGVVVGQLHFPPVFLAKTDNPILIWSGEWSSGDLTARDVSLGSVTSHFNLYLNATCVFCGCYSYADEGEGVIEVVPSAGGMVVLGVAGVALMRRRRGDRRKELSCSR